MTKEKLLQLDCKPLGEEQLSVVVYDVDGSLQLWIEGGGSSSFVLSTMPDQWGTWITFEATALLTIGQEDGNPSFLGALCEALQFIRSKIEVS